MWIKFDYSKVEAKAERESKQLWKFNCTSKTVVPLSAVYYTADGNVAGQSAKSDFAHNYRPVVPESFGETAMHVVCSEWTDLPAK